MLLGIEKGNRSKDYVTAAKIMGIPYKLIDAKSSYVIDNIKDIDALIWHWSQENAHEKRSAYAIIKSVEMKGIKVYPNSNTCWMFDDKIFEKYLLEAAEVPMIKTMVFYEYEKAIRWLKTQTFPLVYKLSHGAGSTNVRLVHNYEEAKKICKIHFSTFLDPEFFLNLYYKKIKNIEDIKEYFKKPLKKYGNNNRGSILFQEFLPDNSYDIRVTVVGKKYYIFRRYVRENDFRASGSGKIDYCVDECDLEAIKIAVELSNKINVQTMAYDFLYDKNHMLKICEISYGFVGNAINRTPGWYDENLIYHKEKTDVYKEIINLLVDEIGESIY